MNNFSSIENKRNIWEFMKNNDFFKNLHDDKGIEVQRFFETSIQTIIETNKTQNNIIDLNKKLIHNMYEFIKTISTNKSVHFRENKYVSKDMNAYTAEEESKKRQEDFHLHLNTHQTEFNNMMTKNTPKEIDFSDNSREIQIKNMEEQIEKTVDERDKELNNIYKSINIKDNSNKKIRLEINDDCDIVSHDIEHIESIKNIDSCKNTNNDIINIQNNISELENKVQKILGIQQQILDIINKDSTKDSIKISDIDN